jgi:hypothetical protein
MSARPRQLPGESVSVDERVAILETQMGDAESGVLGELKRMGEQFRSMETRLYTFLGGGSVIFWLVNRWF